MWPNVFFEKFVRVYHQANMAHILTVNTAVLMSNYYGEDATGTNQISSKYISSHRCNQKQDHRIAAEFFKSISKV